MKFKSMEAIDWIENVSEKKQKADFSRIEQLTTEAVAKHKEGGEKEAIAFYLEVIELDSNQPAWVYGNVITLMAQVEPLDEGLELGDKALNIHPESDVIYRAIGILCGKQQDPSNCIQHYQKAIALEPMQPDWLYCNLAKQLLQVSKTSDAIEIIQSGINFYPKNYLLHYCLGEIFIEGKEWNKALKSLKKARSLKPDLKSIQDKLNEIIILNNSHSVQFDNSFELLIQKQIEEVNLKSSKQEESFNESSFEDYLNYHSISNHSEYIFFGEIACISGNQVIGWIADENFVKNNIEVKLLINGLQVSKSVANLSKQQFENINIKNVKINKRCFFRLQIPDSHLNTNTLLCLEVVCPDETVLAIENNYYFDIKGNIDLINNDRIAGWVVDSNKAHPLELDLYLDGRKVKELVANIERNDVQIGLQCGFDTYFPSDIYRGQKIELTLRNSKIPILDTPKQVITSVGIINILHKLSQYTRNDLVGLSNDEKQWVNLKLVPSLINEFRSSTKSNTQANISYSLNQVFSSVKPSTQTIATVDVIIPVYKNYQVTKICIESVIKSRQSNKTPINIVVIDDRSPEPQISIYLKDIAAQNLIELLVNEENQGFVRSVNQGMRLHPERDVILLNSDAIVNGDWLDRLKYLGYSQPNIASVTPISNHASIFSYPFFAEEIGELPKDTSLETLDAICKDVNYDIRVDVPSVHGFCCYLKQCALSEVGLFDEQKWEKGYGEEVDWSQRALLLGWKHIAAPGIFVHHVGSQSFTETKHHAIARAQKILSSDYPEYDAVVQDFISADTLAPFRRKVDIARLKKISTKYFLFIAHDFGGGTKKYLTDLSKRLAEEGYQALCLMPDQRNWTKLCSLGEIQLYSRYNLNKITEFKALIEDLKSINIVHVHINSTIGFNQENNLWQIPLELQVDFDVTIHDYQFICPRINLTTAKNKYCGEPSAEACDVCIVKNGTYNDTSLNNLFHELGSVSEWRNYYLEKLKKARKIFAPTHDVKTRISRYFSGIEIDVKYHPESHGKLMLKSFISQDSKSVYCVALIGAISDIKGYQLLQECAAYAINFNLPIKFTVFGYTKDDLPLEEYSNINIAGAFKDLNELKEKLKQNPCDIAAFLSIWPETYSYTLSEALSLGLLPLGLNIGAIGERIKQIPGGVVLDSHATPKTILLKIIKMCQFSRENTINCNLGNKVFYSNIINDYYDLKTLE